ncbi:hypothetical protein EIN_093640 [Entamoeba invadens IP1]|uniref:Uncharacterized protein n=1 Tax=Entamoeba invadens IP1 TaxID=370355 RepID=A0A0A1TZY9_ENTIV|nr:hypothetical protein EIN_093640 [Entamoeba invadens IP1]ELP87207.1 hypothetical protein EIN_093640 [Entamoeba invadens IP1]|eukprot:XP_004253978.1 hypothetical protein EIN_093640 [Entamoeba invadens IP1]
MVVSFLILLILNVFALDGVVNEYYKAEFIDTKVQYTFDLNGETHWFNLFNCEEGNYLAITVQTYTAGNILSTSYTIPIATSVTQPIENSYKTVVSINECSKQLAKYCDGVIQMSTSRRSFIQTSFTPKVATKSLTQTDDPDKTHKTGEHPVYAMWDLLRDNDSQIITKESTQFKMKLLANTENPIMGSICLLANVAEMSTNSYVMFPQDNMSLAMINFNLPNTKNQYLLYVTAEIPGYFPYYYNYIVVQSAAVEYFVLLAMCVFMLF